MAEGVLRNVDGALVSAFAYRGPDLDAATAEELEALSRTLAKAFSPLGDGWMLHLDAHRLAAPGYPPEGAFPDPFTRALDAERREAWEARGGHYRTECFLTVTFRPAPGERPALGSLFGARGAEGDEEERLLARFEAQLEDLGRLLATQLELRRLSSRDLVGYLYRCLTFRDQPLGLPDYPVSLEAIFGSGDLYAGYEVRFGETAIVPVALAGFPEASTPASLDFLGALPFPYHAVTRYLPLDPWSARKAVTARRTRWSNAGLGLREVLGMIFGGKGGGGKFRNRYAPAMAEDADQALYELEAGEGGAGYLTATVLLHDPDRQVALERAGAVVKELRNRGFVAWVEELNAVHAYLGSLPGCGWYNVRRPLFLARSFLDLAPTTSIWPGEATHPHPALRGQPAHVVASTSGSTPFYLSLAHHDVQHALVVGPTGSGKSVLVNLLLAQYLRYPEAQVFAIDKGWSLYATTVAARGAHYALSADEGGPGDHRFAPLAHLETAGDRQRAGEWLEDLLRLQGVVLDPELKRLAHRALELLASGGNRTLTNLAAKLQHPVLRQAVQPYTDGGTYGHLFDGSGNPLREGHLQVFEMESVLPLEAAVVTPLVLHLFAEIERRLDGRPTLILVEEALAYLGETLWSQRFTSWLFELRKRNAGVVFVGQTLSSFLASPLRAALLEGCPTRIFLPNPGAREEGVAEAYRTFGLNDRQVELVASAIPRRDYYAVAPAGSRLFRLDLSPGALAILGLAGPDGRETVRRAMARHGHRWAEAFLREGGHDHLAGLIATAAGHGESPRVPAPHPTDREETR